MFRCFKCGVEVFSPSYKCPQCFLTGTLVPFALSQKVLPEPIVSETVQTRVFTGFDNMDRLLGGGGIVMGGIHYFTAPPGTGKSTLLSQVAAYLRKKGYTVYFFTGEETPELVMARALRLGIAEFQPEIFYRKEIGELAKTVRGTPPDILIVDSLQSILGTETNRLNYEAQTSIMLQLRKLTDSYKCATWVIGQVNKDDSFNGPQSLAHYSDVVIEAKRGLNDEVILTTPTKNRYGPTNRRAVFRMTEKGLEEKDEKETSYILRHQSNHTTAGLAAFIATTPLGLTVDEVTVVSNGKKTLQLIGGSNDSASFIETIIKIHFAEFEPCFIVRANLSEKLPKSSDLAIVMAVLSKFYDKPLPLGTAFIATIDAIGRLITVPNMGLMVQRAKDQGYSRVFGAMPIGSQVATWETANTIKDVWGMLGF